MDFGLRCAYAHGVSAIRTHIDTYPETAERSWQVVREMHSDWQDKIDLQAVALCPIDLLTDEFGDKAASIIAKSGGLLGGITRASIGNHCAPLDNMDFLLDRLFALATRHDLDIDLHVDETHDPSAATLPTLLVRQFGTATKAAWFVGIVAAWRCNPKATSTARSISLPKLKSRSLRCLRSICTCKIARRSGLRAGAASPSSTKSKSAVLLWRRLATIAATVFTPMAIMT